MLSRFPIRVQLVGRYFWQSGQKLDENNKINILGAKLGDMGRGKPIFGVVEEPLPVPSLMETLPIIIREIKKQRDLEYLTFFCKASH